MDGQRRNWRNARAGHQRLATSVVSVATTSGTQQLFAGGGAIYTYPAGSATPSTYTVSGTIYAAYYSAGGFATAGFPTTGRGSALRAACISSYSKKARIEWTPGTTPSVAFPLSSILILYSQQGLSLESGRDRDTHSEYLRYAGQSGYRQSAVNLVHLQRQCGYRAGERQHRDRQGGWIRAWQIFM